MLVLYPINTSIPYDLSSGFTADDLTITVSVLKAYLSKQIIQVTFFALNNQPPPTTKKQIQNKTKT